MNKRDRAKELRQKCLDIISKCKSEVREMTDEEQAEFDNTKNELIALSEEIKAVDDKVNEVQEQLPEVEEKAEEAAEEKPVEQSEETVTEEDTKEPEEKSEDENTDENSEINNTEAEEKPVEEETEETPAEDEDKKDTKSNRSIMKDFSLVKAIRSVVNNTPMDEVNAAVINAGAEEFRANGLQSNGQIQIPGEKRTISVKQTHDDVIETEFDSLMTPLYAKTALVESGAQMLTGLRGDIQIPIIDGKNQVGWGEELAEAMKTSNTFTSKKMSPHRITCYLDISKMLISQDSIGVESAIRQDLLNALAAKLEETFLGAGDGSITVGEGEDKQTIQNVAPKGILNGKVAKTVANYAALCDFEAELECEDIYAPARYILSPKAKAALRAMNYGGKTTGMVMDTPNSVDGTPAVSTTYMGKTGKKFAYGDFSEVVIGQWGGLDLTVDTITQATRGAIRLVINAYYDCIVKRPEAILVGEIA